LRVMAGDFRKQFDEALKEAELDDVKTLVNETRKLNPAADLRKAFDPMRKAAEDVRAGLDPAMKPEAGPEPTPATTPAEPEKQDVAAVPGEATSALVAAATETVPAKTAAKRPAAKTATARTTAAKKPPAKAASGSAAPKTAKAAAPIKTTKTGGKAK